MFWSIGIVVSPEFLKSNAPCIISFGVCSVEASDFPKRPDTPPRSWFVSSCSSCLSEYSSAAVFSVSPAALNFSLTSCAILTKSSGVP